MAITSYSYEGKEYYKILIRRRGNEGKRIRQSCKTDKNGYIRVSVTKSCKKYPLNYSATGLTQIILLCAGLNLLRFYR